MLKPSEVKAFQKILVAMLTRLDKSRAELRDEAMRASGSDASGNLSNLPTHLADLGDVESNENVALGMLENEESLIQEIEIALTRIDKKSYGVCEACTKPIAVERLQAVPYARHCVACARKTQEKR